MRELNIANEFLERYVDDITVILAIIRPGTRYIEGKLEICENEVESEQQKNDDERTMLVIKDIADSIDENIVVTYDVPSRYKDEKVPILDIKAGIKEDNKVEYVFYKKQWQISK